MKAVDFQSKLSCLKIPAIARMVAQRAVSELNNGNFKTIEATEIEFNLICKYADYKPIDPSLGSPFIRIFDSEGNSKDIELANPWKK